MLSDMANYEIYEEQGTIVYHWLML